MRISIEIDTQDYAAVADAIDALKKFIPDVVPVREAVTEPAPVITAKEVIASTMDSDEASAGTFQTMGKVMDLAVALKAAVTTPALPLKNASEEDVAKATMDLATKKGFPAAIEVLSKFGAKRATEIPAEKRNEYFAAATAALQS